MGCFSIINNYIIVLDLDYDAGSSILMENNLVKCLSFARDRVSMNETICGIF